MTLAADLRSLGKRSLLIGDRDTCECSMCVALRRAADELDRLAVIDAHMPTILRALHDGADHGTPGWMDACQEALGDLEASS